MNTKTVIKLAAFLLTFVVGSGLVYSFSPKIDPKVAQKISGILREDAAYGTERALETGKLETAAVVSAYSAHSAALDIEGLPDDFQNAWLKHMNAWHAYSDFLRDSEMRDAGDRRDRSDLRRLWKRNIENINDTWYRVVRIAGKYGAELPENPY